MDEKEWKPEYEQQFMTKEQQESSKVREQYHEQWKNPFHDIMDYFDLDHDTTERRQPTPEEKERLDRYLTDLGQLFEGSDVRWHIDGALNISLLQGKYIGVHKDIDISVDEDDLGKLDELLGSRGFGLFLSEQPELDGVNKMTRAHDTSVRENYVRHVTIARINERGEITQGQNLNFLDVHILRKNQAGKIVTAEGAELPESWQETRQTDFNGTKLNIAHPSEVAYHKLRQGWPNIRKYDEADLRLLAQSGQLQVEDIQDIEGLLRREIEQRQMHAENVAKIVYRDYEMDPETNDAMVLAAIMSYPPIKKRAGDPEFTYVIMDLAEEINKSSSKTFENITAILSKTFLHKEFYNDQFARITKLKEWMEEGKKTKQAREKLTGIYE